MSQNTNVAALAVLGLVALTASYKCTPQALESNIVNRKPYHFRPDPECRFAFVSKPMNVREKMTSM